MKVKLLTILGATLFLGACTIPGFTPKETAPAAQEEVVESPDTREAMEMEKSYTMEEIMKHATPEDCWFAIDGKVYDVTGFGAKHPGSKAVYQGCGMDATELFETRPMGSGVPHSQNAREMMEDFEIGTLSI